MSERDTYPPGVPCWVDTMQADHAAAKDFYAGLMGWEFQDGPGYAVAMVRGRAVAGVGEAPEGVPPPWTTYVRCEELEPVVDRVREAGGSVLQEPQEVGPPGRLAIVADPSGAPLGLWQAGDREGAERLNEPGAWAMSALLTADGKAACAFYGAVFGWTFDATAHGLWMCRLKGYVGGEPQQPVPRDVVAAIIETPQDEAHGWSVDFWVHDADSTAEEAARLGGTLLEPPNENTPMFRRAVIADPAGAAFSISQLLL